MKNSLLFLGGLSKDSMVWLSSIGQRRTLTAGEILIQEGESIEHIFILLSGNLVVTTSAAGTVGHRRQVARLTAGEIIGEMSLIDHRPPSATVTAEVECEVLAIPQMALREMAERDVEFGQQFYRGLAYCLSNRLRMMNVSLPQAGIEVNGILPPELENPEIQHNLPIAKARLEMLIGIDQ